MLLVGGGQLEVVKTDDAVDLGRELDSSLRSEKSILRMSAIREEGSSAAQ